MWIGRLQACGLEERDWNVQFCTETPAIKTFLEDAVDLRSASRDLIFVM
jgi:hypothetical protein